MIFDHTFHPFFLRADHGQRFCVFYPANANKALGAVIYIHPFAEELNKSRRMVALQSRALAAAGYDVLQIDLLGCGDSSGDFVDASWKAWCSDVSLAYHWLRSQSEAPLILWGLRAGCLLTAAAAADLPETANFIFWQPVISGKQHWRHFMRLGSAANMLIGQAIRTANMRSTYAQSGQSVEVAGYSVSLALAEGLQEAELSPPAGKSGRVAWLAISNSNELGIEPAASETTEQWRGAGYDVSAHLVQGPAFWQTAEIEEVNGLVTVTLDVLGSWR